MTISGTMTNAISGLSASSRATEVIASNVSNAQTPGYAVRTLDLASNPTGGGVIVTGVTRNVDLSLLNDQRAADANTAAATLTSDFFTQLETPLGAPGDTGSLNSDVTALQTSLIQAGAQPSSDAGLSSVLAAATALTQQINTISTQIQTARTAADGSISTEVSQVNTGLSKIVDMNSQIVAQTAAGRDASGLVDQRQQLIDQLSGVVPIRQVPQANGGVALYTTGGATLLDGKAATLGFTATPTITPDMTVDTGALSGLTLNGQPIASPGSSALIAGGTLAANFQIRDTLSVTAQGQIDGVAQDLIDRFSSTTTDPTLPSGAPGLFTDGGTAVAPGNEAGLAGRITVNPIADPSQGGTLAKLRDGLGATVAGAVGDGSILNAMGSALSAFVAPSTGGLTSAATDFSGLAASFLSSVSTSRLSADTTASYTAAKSTSLKTLSLQGGVDTDQQLQQLLVVQRSYAANAKVIQTADDMLQSLLGIQ